jgi:hypothetical protein
VYAAGEEIPQHRPVTGFVPIDGQALESLAVYFHEAAGQTADAVELADLLDRPANVEFHLCGFLPVRAADYGLSAPRQCGQSGSLPRYVRIHKDDAGGFLGVQEALCELVPRVTDQGAANLPIDQKMNSLPEASKLLRKQGVHQCRVWLPVNDRDADVD